jgi:hypothetical protein
MVHRDGPQWADTTAVAERESTAGQQFLSARSSLGWNPSVRSTIQHPSRISDRVLTDARRHQQTQAAKQATDTNVSNAATDFAEALGKIRETLQLPSPSSEIRHLRTPVTGTARTDMPVSGSFAPLAVGWTATQSRSATGFSSAQSFT